MATLQKKFEAIEENRYQAALRVIREMRGKTAKNEARVVAYVGSFLAMHDKSTVLLPPARKRKKEKTNLDTLGNVLLGLFASIAEEYKTEMQAFLSNDPLVAYDMSIEASGASKASKMSPKSVASTLSSPWQADGLLWEERIDRMAAYYADAVKKMVLMDVMSSAPKTRIMLDVEETFGKLAKRAETILRTEEARMRSWAMEEAFAETNVQNFKFVATIDERTSKICRSMHMKVFPMSAWEIGETVPPLHPNCRSVVVPE